MNRTVLVLSTLLPLAACGESDEDVIEEVRVESDRLVLELREGARLYHETCVTELVAVSQEDPSGGSTPLFTDVEELANRWDGYWLDGDFRYPSTDEGCDVVMCSAVDFDPEVGRMVFEVTGMDVPPDDLEEYIETYPWVGEAAEQVEVVESAPMEGLVRLELTYYRDADCRGRTHSESVLVELD